MMKLFKEQVFQVKEPVSLVTPNTKENVVKELRAQGWQINPPRIDFITSTPADPREMVLIPKDNKIQISLRSGCSLYSSCTVNLSFEELQRFIVALQQCETHIGSML